MDHQKNLDRLTEISRRDPEILDLGQKYPGPEREVEQMLFFKPGDRVRDPVSGKEVTVIAGTRKAVAGVPTSGD